jgi:tRNA-binding EMAP/Myf-like protein
MADISQYKVGVVLSLEDSGKGGGGKALKACKVNVGDIASPITLVTAAPNVREGSRYALLCSFLKSSK